MKTALITTTINVPKVLELYRSFDQDVFFFVAGDKKTPHSEVKPFVKSLGNAEYYSDADQAKLGYKCSEIIGWNTIRRRNIALLEAIRYGADVIVTVDDDNIPINKDYFNDFRAILTGKYSGIKANSELRWFDIGQFLTPPVHHRGFPQEYRHVDMKMRLGSVSGAKVGVAAGLWMGDPDVDAIERMVNQPVIHNVSELMQSGLIVDNKCFTPFDSQNTAFIGELAPLMMCWIDVGRYDDIWASYVAERVMMETDYHVHYGKPFVWQERNPQSLLKNLKEETYGMEFTMKFSKDLLNASLPSGKLLEKLRSLYEHLHKIDYLPRSAYQLGVAWCNDVEKVA